jgi:hypothetical protein
MDQGQLLRLWAILAVAALVLLVVGALTNRVTVYRNNSDLGFSLAFISAPILGAILIAFIAGENVDIWRFATTTSTGWFVLSVSGLTIVLSGFQTYRFSISDNGLVLGLFIGTAKLVVAAIIAVSSIGLVRYLFRESRRFGHIAIFFMLASVLGWFVNTLVNGERTGAAGERG